MNPLVALQNLVRRDDQTIGTLDQTIGQAFSSFFGGGQAQPQQDRMAPFREAIAGIESRGSGDYNAIGPTDPRLGRALGRYQVMEANVGPWSQAALGRQVSADEFMASPEIQDAVFNHRFGQYVDQFGPEGAAQAWFAGPGGVGRMGRRDQLGTSVADYTERFNREIGSTDDLYRTVGGALGVSISTQGTLAPRERNDVEAQLGAILNEIYDPQSEVDADRRARVADLFTGLGVGFGQMSRGQTVDLSSVRDAAERRRNQNIQLRMERARRAAGASYAMELGDEGMARAIAGGAADIGTLLTSRQMQQVEERALRQEARQMRSNTAMIQAIEDAGIPLSDAQREAIALNGGDALSTITAAQDRSRALAALAAENDRAEQVRTANLAIAEQLMQTQNPARMAAAQLMIANGGDLSFADAEAQLGTLFGNQGEAYTLNPGDVRFNANNQPVASVPAAAPAPSAAEQTIERLMSLGYSREQAVQAQAGILQLDSDGVLRNIITSEPVNPLTTGLSTPSDQQPQAQAQPDQIGPPRDESGTSLFNRIGEATGMLSAGQGLLESTVGQVLPGTLFPERTQTIQEFNTLRGLLIDAYRNSGRLLSQELQLMLDEVAPGSSIWQSPGQLQARMESIDRELRTRLREERARANDPGVPARDRTLSANLAADIDRVLARLHEPSPEVAQRAGEAETPSDLPAELQSSPQAMQTLQAAAENAGVTVQELWQYMSEEDRRLFLGD